MPLQDKMEFEGKDIAEAISLACESLNVSQENLDIEVLSTGTSGIFGLCSKKARLRASVKKEAGQAAEEKPPGEPGKTKSVKVKNTDKKKERPAKEQMKVKAAKAEPAETACKPAEESAVGEDLLADVKAYLGKILDLMCYSSEVSVSSEGENVTVQIQGQYVGEIIGQNGKILDSLQYLLRKIISKKYNEKAIISLDAGDFRAARTDELKQLALDLTAEVKKNGKTRSIPSLNPSERRIVHLILQDDKEIRSRSVGEGLFKKVLIYLPGSKGKKSPTKRRRGGRNKKN